MESTWHEGFCRRKAAARAARRRAGGGGGDWSGDEALPPCTPQQQRRPGDGVPPSRAASEPSLRASGGGGGEAGGNDTGVSAAFLERQFQHHTVERDRKYAKLKLQAAQTLHDMDDVEFWGAQGVPGFRTYLRKKFGSIIAGWRALDRDSNGRITFCEFCNACRRMGFHGNLKYLWRDLDTNLNGYVTLAEIDPEAGQLLGRFKLRLLEEYGDMLTAWQKGIDINGSGRIEEPELEACCRRLNFEVDTKRLYSILRSSPSKSTHGVTLAMFDPDAARRLDTGDLKGLCSGRDKEFLEDLPETGEGADLPEGVRGYQPGGALAWRRELRDKDKAEVQEELQEIKKFKKGLHTVEGFKRTLVARFGSLLGAWRKALDLDGNGRIALGEFCVALHRMALDGDVKGLWGLLDTEGKGYIVFADLDRPTAEAVAELKQKLAETHGNLLLAWLRELDKKHTGFVDKAGFVEACQRVGFSGNAARLFHMMKPEAGRRLLTIRDFDTKAAHALDRGDFRMLTEAEGPQKTLEKGAFFKLPFQERQEAGFYFQIRKGWDAARREEFAKITGEAFREHVIDTPEEFRLQCVRKYGSVIAAWRQCLDIDANGRLTFNEFCTACRRLGYAGDLKALWGKYGGPDRGCITLQALDPVADELVSSFLTLLGERYGSLDKAWKNGFGKDPHGGVDEEQLERVCQALGYPHPAHKLFKCLQSSPGRVLLTIWDIDPACTRKRRRGDAALINEMPLAESSTGSPAGSLLLNPHDSMAQRMRRAMRNKHGTTLAAWRAIFGTWDKEVIYFPDLCRLLQACEFSGNSRALWHEIADGQDGITFRQVDPEVQGAIDQARTALIARFGCLVVAWASLCKPYFESLDKGTDEAGRRPGSGGFAEWPLTSGAFCAACERLGSGVKGPERVFKLLLSDGQRRLRRDEDFRALLLGLPREEQEGAWGDQPAAAASEEEAEEDAASQAPRPLVLRGDAAEVAKLAEAARAAKYRRSDSLDALKKTLAFRHGSLFSAWRNALDLDRNGLVTQAEFVAACQPLGFRNVLRVWAELDVNRQGQVSFKDLDPETNDGLSALGELLAERHGSAEEGWRQCFELPEPRGPWVDEAKFVRQCGELGLPGDSRRLFRKLRAEPGRKYLSSQDIWRSVNKNATTAEVPSAPPPRPRSRSGAAPPSPGGGASQPRSRQAGGAPGGGRGGATVAASAGG